MDSSVAAEAAKGCALFACLIVVVVAVLAFLGGRFFGKNSVKVQSLIVVETRP